MYGWKRMCGNAIVCLAIVVLFGMISGHFNWILDESEAQIAISPSGQQGQKIVTYIIDPATFSLLTDRPPVIDINDHATTYTMQSNASVTFMPSGSAAKTINLDAGDIVIERPLVGTLTVVQDR